MEEVGSDLRKDLADLFALDPEGLWTPPNTVFGQALLRMRREANEAPEIFARFVNEPSHGHSPARDMESP